MQDIIDADVGQSQHSADTGGHHLLTFPNQTEDRVAVELGEISGTADHAVEDFELVFAVQSHHRVLAHILSEIVLHKIFSVKNDIVCNYLISVSGLERSMSRTKKVIY